MNDLNLIAWLLDEPLSLTAEIQHLTNHSHVIPTPTREQMGSAAHLNHVVNQNYHTLHPVTPTTIMGSASHPHRHS